MSFYDIDVMLERWAEQDDVAIQAIYMSECEMLSLYGETTESVDFSISRWDWES